MKQFYILIVTTCLSMSVFGGNAKNASISHICLAVAENPENTIHITWRTPPEMKKSYVVYVEKENANFKYDTILSTHKTFDADDGVWVYHEVALKGLVAGTEYSYQIGAADEWTDWMNYETAKANDEAFEFIYFGDVQTKLLKEGKESINNAVHAFPDSKFLLFAGDLVNDGKKNKKEWDRFFKAGDTIFRSYPLSPVLGNHEHSTRKMHYQPDELWYYNFALPQNGPRGSLEESYYFDYQGTRFITINTSTFISNPFVRGRTVRWFKSLVKHYEGNWIVVSQHHPVFSTKEGRRNRSIQRRLKPLYEKYKVALVLSGHDHTYGRGAVPGSTSPVYVVSNAGGKHYNLGFDDWLHRGGSAISLYQYIRVESDAIHYQSYLSSGELYDEFKLKRKGGTLELVDLQQNAVKEILELPDKYREGFTEEQLKNYNNKVQNYLDHKKQK